MTPEQVRIRCAAGPICSDKGRNTACNAKSSSIAPKSLNVYVGIGLPRRVFGYQSASTSFPHLQQYEGVIVPTHVPTPVLDGNSLLVWLSGCAAFVAGPPCDRLLPSPAERGTNPRQDRRKRNGSIARAGVALAKCSPSYFPPLTVWGLGGEGGERARALWG